MGYQAKVKTNLNVRTGPGTSNAKIGLLKTGTVVDVIEEKNGWGHLIAGDLDGWSVKSALIKIKGTTAAPVAPAEPPEGPQDAPQREPQNDADADYEALLERLDALQEIITNLTDRLHACEDDLAHQDERIEELADIIDRLGGDY